jgi:hypothetical protein
MCPVAFSMQARQLAAGTDRVQCGVQDAAAESEGDGRRTRRSAEGASRCLDYQNPAPRAHVTAAMHKQARPFPLMGHHPTTVAINFREMRMRCSQSGCLHELFTWQARAG